MSAQGAIEAILSHPSTPAGVVVGVEHGGRRSVAAGGLASVDGVHMSVDTAFDIASVTKVVATSTAMLGLVTLGCVSFDDPVRRFLPMAGCAEGTTIRHLLQHRAGLWEWQPLYLAGGDEWDWVDSLPLRYPLDQGRHYSDIGFMLLGRIIAQVTGIPLREAVRELVTAPLGLTSTSYGPVAGPVASSAMGDAAERKMVATSEPYPVLARGRRDFVWREHEIVGVVNDGNCFHALDGVSGHAGVFSTVDDLLELGSALAGAEQHTDLWHPDALDEMFREGPDAGQALGWRSGRVHLHGREYQMLWHPGFTGCALGIIPDAHTAVALLSNRLLASEPATTDALWRAALPALLGQEQPTRIEGTRAS